MEIQDKHRRNKQESLFVAKEKLDDEGRQKIIDQFRLNHENTVRNIAENTGYPMKTVNRVIDKFLAKKTPGGKKLFSESIWNDPIAVCKELNRDSVQKARYGDADCHYYVEAVLNYSEKNPKTKRTDRGWIATIRQFMNSDKGNKRFKKIQHEESLKDKRRNHQNF